MTSILTNTSSMIALQTLKSINKDLGNVQEQVSSGKKVGSAKDNAATWAISKVMEADVTTFKKISEGLSVAESTVAVARDASESVVKLLTDMKGKIVQSLGTAQDKAKLQADIAALRSQIETVVGAAQLNGTNLINGAGSNLEVLSSLSRDSAGAVSVGNIQVARQNLSTAGVAVAATFGTEVTAADETIINGGTGNGTAVANAMTVAAGAKQNINIASVGNGYSYRISFTGTAADGTTALAKDFEYTANGNNSIESVADTLTKQMDAYFSANGVTGKYSVARVGGQLQITNASSAATTVSIDASTAGTAASGNGLAALKDINVVTNAGLALTAIDGLLQTATSAAAAFGTVQNQLSTQNDFVGKLVTSMQAGIGSMVDADMEEASARLQALQTQQQLGIQSLAIANQAPAAILALFR
ncbi:flagellin [Bacillus altitudinis]|uniref:flagellin N-terminal helical domain-containing protein n=1 Tax=Bacillus altitudinis TaxID=293387 RepID=UPI003D049D35